MLHDAFSILYPAPAFLQQHGDTGLAVVRLYNAQTGKRSRPAHMAQ